MAAAASGSQAPSTQQQESAATKVCEKPVASSSSSPSSSSSSSSRQQRTQPDEKPAACAPLPASGATSNGYNNTSTPSAKDSSPGPAKADKCSSSPLESKNHNATQNLASKKKAKPAAKEKANKKTKKNKQPDNEAKEGMKVHERENGSSKQQKKSNEASGDLRKAEAPVTVCAKPRALVEELKLFQNNQLLQQKDPLQQLHKQLNALIEDGADSNNNIRAQSSNSDGHEKSANMHQQQRFGDLGPSPMGLQQCQSANYQQGVINSSGPSEFVDDSENNSTVKKGVLWQQQNYDKFHQRLFSRWKKRYFILTTDYLVCFKRSAAKVGRSEMGKFLYKTSLSDVTRIDWLKPKKSDKGAIILYINGQFNLFLWTKDNLEEWMFMIKESIERNRIRRSCIMQNESKRVVNSARIPITAKQDETPDNLYENAANSIHTAINKNIQYSPDEIDSSLALEINNALSNVPEKPSCAQDIFDSTRFPYDELNNEKMISGREGESSKSDRAKSSPHSGASSGSRRGRLNEDDNTDIVQGDPVGRLNADSSVVRGGVTSEPSVIDDPSNDDIQTGGQSENSSSKETSLSKGHSVGSKRSSLREQPPLRTVDQNLSLDPSKPVVSETGTTQRVEPSVNESPKKSESNLVKSQSRQSSVRKSRKKSNDLVRSSEGCNSGPDNNNDCNNERRDSVNSFKKKLDHKEILPKRSSTNLIRRDDSWQSLVSLTRIGKVAPIVTPVAKTNTVVYPTKPLGAHNTSTVAQRSLYAQHIMPDNSNNSNKSDRGLNSSSNNSMYNRQHMISIESTVTPSRAPFTRHQSIQAPSQRKLRPFPQLSQQHATSFDASQNLPPLQGVNNIQHHQGTSYQQKLIQLQLLHNSNNVDYIRHNGDATTNSDYQIYGPESMINHYGYSSMRSNLKSATSEFSFIRPSSSHAQSTLPHPHPNTAFVQQDIQGARRLPIRSSLILPAGNKILVNEVQTQQQSDNNNNNNDIGCTSSPIAARNQFLVNPITGERLTNQQQQQRQGFNLTGNEFLSSDLMPPMRELPLKPNKKRATNNVNGINGTGNCAGNLPKSSSLTSSIAFFFRRAFSRRSKKGSRRRSKLAESCSSSLGAYDENFTEIPVVPSAFSTGSKSVDGGRRHQQLSSEQQKVAQAQRMVDMIEAFTNKTHSADTEPITQMTPKVTGPFVRDESGSVRAPCTQISLNLSQNTQNVTPRMTPSKTSQLKIALNQFGSPLHKSNSISATMGLSLNDVNNRRALLYDNELTAGANGMVDGASPILMRSTKGLNANLTPLMSQKHRDDLRASSGAADAASYHQFFLSPRNGRLDQHHSARPSSIYGQPSMISSHMLAREERNNFGAHRNSLHNHHFQNNPVFESRRHQQVVARTPFLDTTKEVAEEVSSPTTESRSLDYEQSLAFKSPNQAGRSSEQHQSPHAGQLISRDNKTKYDKMSASPSGNQLYPNSKQAIVNPILQSSTMDTIYDNHPMLNGLAESSSSYSHYDNQLLTDHSQQQYQQRQNQRHQSPSVRSTQFLPSSPSNFSQDQYGHHKESAKISHLNHPSSSNDGHHQRFASGRTNLAHDIQIPDKKPSAIVVPSTSDHHQNSNNNFCQNDLASGSRNSPVLNHHSQFGLAGSSRNINTPTSAHLSRSPLLPKRNPNQLIYQQSPLVSLETRVMNKGDGVQATIIGGERDLGSSSSSGYRPLGQPVINIAGAPGINLEPSLAASLLRGTNIDAYESSTFNRVALDNNPANSHSKTFLVSTRLSKSMAYRGSLPNENESLPSSMASRNESTSSVANKQASRDDELSSSGSRSITSSIGRGSLRARVSTTSGTNSSQDEPQEYSSSSSDNTNASHSSKENSRRNQNNENENHLNRKNSSRASRSKPREEATTR